MYLYKYTLLVFCFNIKICHFVKQLEKVVVLSWWQEDSGSETKEGCKRAKKKITIYFYGPKTYKCGRQQSSGAVEKQQQQKEKNTSTPEKKHDFISMVWYHQHGETSFHLFFPTASVLLFFYTYVRIFWLLLDATYINE